MDWTRVDWVDVTGSTLAELLGGRPAIAIRAAVRIWGQAREKVNAQLSDELQRQPHEANLSAENVLGPLGLSDLDTTAVDFSLSILAAWRRSETTDLPLFLDDLATNVWRNASHYRRLLAQVALDPAEIRLLCRDAGIDITRIQLSGSAEHQWFSLLELLRTQPLGQLLFLLYLASLRAPAEFRLRYWE